MSKTYGGPPSQPTKFYTGSYQETQPVLVLFNGAYIQQNTIPEDEKWEGDAQIAARRAMSKRSSRSYSARVSRAKSRKKERLVKPAKPTIDTSFSRHHGEVPRQMYPQDGDLSRGGSVNRHNFLGLRRPSMNTKGLGIMKGTPQPDGQTTSHKASNSLDKEPKTADSLAPANQVWAEISPSDRPIPIGISIPSDSIPDFSPCQANRLRSGSDATLVTPSIIITPAAAMKSVWSPDTESEYTPSVYSRATFNPFTRSDVPPVPALPTEVTKSSAWQFNDTRQGISQPVQNRPRHDTLDSAGTAFEDMDSPLRSKDRVTSTATMFEEDEIPLRSNNMQSIDLTIDTSAAVPTPRRSQGWWNFITTPFEFSRANSVWTQNGRNTERTPDIPMMPRQYARRAESPSTPSTYIWSATEKSPSVDGRSPKMDISLSAALAAQPVNEKQDSSKGVVDNVVDRSETMRAGIQTKSNDKAGTRDEHAHHVESETAQRPQQTGFKGDNNVTSPLSAMSASPVVSTATFGTVLMPRQIPEQQTSQQHQPQPQPTIINIGTHDSSGEAKTAQANASPEPRAGPAIQTPPAPASFFTTNARAQTPPHFPPPPSRDSPPPQIFVNTGLTRSANLTPPPEFLPPPRAAYSSHYSAKDHNSRSSSPVSITKLKKQSGKKHRKVFNVMECLPFGKRKGKNNKSDDKTKKKTSRSRKWCWGCCCCLIILILLAIIIPIVVVVGGRKSNDDSKTTEPPSQWLNLTGYPPIPTGVSTIAQPEAVDSEKGCVSVATVWSCAIPKEEQETGSRNKPDQPNLKFEITFENGTVQDASKTLPARRALNAVSAGALVRSRFLNVRAAPSASPAAPSMEDYDFLGNTTDLNQAPFEGEETPFFLSILNAKESKKRSLALRADEPVSNITKGIPDPELDSDGTAAAANLLPSASNQPLRLFNRGKDDEHYGFFVYYDRSIFLKDTSRNFTNGGNPADIDGGSRKDAATMRCTWAQTRFLVQIWTKSQSTKALLRSGTDPDSDDPLVRPGTFPYPVTVTLDRHGGRASQKMVYCYSMEKDGTIINDDANKKFIIEDRRFGGTLVNPARGISENVRGPVDGGTGGCGCKWQNWSI